VPAEQNFMISPLKVHQSPINTMTSPLSPYPQYKSMMTILDLPRELRDLIWDFTFRGGGEAQFREGSLSFSVRYKIQQDDEIDEAKIRENSFGDEILDADTLLPVSSDGEDDDSERAPVADDVETSTLGGEGNTASNSASLSSIVDPDEADEEQNEEESDNEGNIITNDELLSGVLDPEHTNEFSESLQESLIFPPPADIRWLLTNRQVLAEGVEQFYRHAHCTSYSDVNYYWDYSHHFYLERYLAKKKEIYYPVSVFTFAKITSISLSLRLGTEIEGRDGKWYEKLIPERDRDSPAADDDLRDIIRHVQTLGMTSLTHLNIGVWIFQTEAVSQEPTNNMDEVRSEDEHKCLSGYQDIQVYEVDLSFLTGIGTQFKHIEIMLFPTFMRAANDDYGVEGSFVVVPMLQKELARVAKIMIGSDGWIVKDWILKEIAQEPWRLDVTKGVEGQQEGTLEHIGFRTWPGQDFDGDNDTFHLQEDQGDGVMRWIGSYSDNEVAIQVPTIREELGDYEFQRTSVSVKDEQ
jgi:hypothetical protein